MMHKDWLVSLPLFAALYEEGSYSRAAQRLNCSVAHVSRKISALELMLEKQLVIRTTRTVKMTQAGEQLYRLARRVHAVIDEGESQLRYEWSTLKRKSQYKDQSGAIL